jgi:hypothetical protein
MVLLRCEVDFCLAKMGSASRHYSLRIENLSGLPVSDSRLKARPTDRVQWLLSPLATPTFVNGRIAGVTAAAYAYREPRLEVFDRVEALSRCIHPPDYVEMGCDSHRRPRPVTGVSEELALPS